MGLVCGLLFVGRALSGVLNTQAGGDNHHLGERAIFAGFKDHTGKSWIQGNRHQLPTQLGQFASAINGLQFFQ